MNMERRSLSTLAMKGKAVRARPGICTRIALHRGAAPYETCLAKVFAGRWSQPNALLLPRALAQSGKAVRGCRAATRDTEYKGIHAGHHDKVRSLSHTAASESRRGMRNVNRITTHGVLRQCKSHFFGGEGEPVDQPAAVVGNFHLPMAVRLDRAIHLADDFTACR